MYEEKNVHYEYHSPRIKFWEVVRSYPIGFWLFAIFVFVMLIETILK